MHWSSLPVPFPTSWLSSDNTSWQLVQFGESHASYSAYTMSTLSASSETQICAQAGVPLKLTCLCCFQFSGLASIIQTVDWPHLMGTKFSYFSIALIKHYDQGNFKKAFNFCLEYQRVRVQSGGAESIHLDTKVGGRETGNNTSLFFILKSYPQYTTPLTQSHPWSFPNSSANWRPSFQIYEFYVLIQTTTVPKTPEQPYHPHTPKHGLHTNPSVQTCAHQTNSGNNKNRTRTSTQQKHARISCQTHSQ